MGRIISAHVNVETVILLKIKSMEFCFDQLDFSKNLCQQRWEIVDNVSTIICSSHPQDENETE